MKRLDQEPGVELAHYRDVHDCCVAIQCQDCLDTRYYRARDVIDQLDRRGLSGAAIGVRELVKHYRATCRSCDGRRFESRPAFDMKEPGSTPFWRREEPNTDGNRDAEGSGGEAPRIGTLD